jgi:hypothetical protein
LVLDMRTQRLGKKVKGGGGGPVMSTFSEQQQQHHHQPPPVTVAAGEVSISIKTLQNVAITAAVVVALIVFTFLALRNWKRTFASWLRAWASKSVAASSGRRTGGGDDDADDDSNGGGGGGDEEEEERPAVQRTSSSCLCTTARSHSHNHNNNSKTSMKRLQCHASCGARVGPFPLAACWLWS